MKYLCLGLIALFTAESSFITKGGCVRPLPKPRPGIPEYYDESSYFSDYSSEPVESSTNIGPGGELASEI